MLDFTTTLSIVYSHGVIKGVVMFRAIQKNSAEDSVTFQITKDGEMMKVKDVLECFVTSPEFIDFYKSILKGIPFDAYFWEHPCLITSKLSDVYEFTLVESKALAAAEEDLKPFEKYFTDDAVVSFKNLRGDARLVVPCPVDVETEYTHLAKFVRTASENQLHAFWKKVGEDVREKISETPFWLSTSGLGVSWLHVRLDSVPKYYKTRRYVDSFHANRP